MILTPRYWSAITESKTAAAHASGGLGGDQQNQRWKQLLPHAVERKPKAGRSPAPKRTVQV
jgi:hypothetical protein